MPEVFIDGIRYVPAKTVQPANARAIKIALLQKFWGDCSADSDEQLDEKWEGVYVDVTDTTPPTQEEFEAHLWEINDLLDEISKLQSQATS